MCCFFPLQAAHFERDDVDLPGFAKFFHKSADEEKQHAEMLMKFQNDRGGRVVLKDIVKPAKDEWGSGLQAMEAALELEKTVNRALLDLHKVADKHGDFHVSQPNSWSGVTCFRPFPLIFTDGRFYRG